MKRAIIGFLLLGIAAYLSAQSIGQMSRKRRAAIIAANTGGAWGTWSSITNSSMRQGGPIIVSQTSSATCLAAGGYWTGTACQLYNPTIDLPPGGDGNDFFQIQNSWGGAACDEANDEMIIWGGGHDDSAHNGVFAVNINTGDWRRITQPSPIWQDTDSGAPYYCPGGTCTPPIGTTCNIDTNCGVYPDSTPASKHTGDQLQYDSGYLYGFAGAIWALSGQTGNAPRHWKLNLSTGAWSPLADLGAATQGLFGTAITNGFVYGIRDSFEGKRYEIATDTWTTGSLSAFVNLGTALEYVPTTDRLYAFGGGRAWSMARTDWPTGAVTHHGAQGLAALNNFRWPGLLYYPPQDLLLLWDGGQTIETFDPATGAWDALMLGGENPGAGLSGGTFQRFNYCGGKIVLINGVDKPLYYVTTSAPADASFTARCGAAGVVLCDPLDTEGPYDGNGTVLTNPDGTEGIPTQTWFEDPYVDQWRGVGSPTIPLNLPELDTTVKASGTGSIRFDQESQSNQGGAGTFVTNFSKDLSVQFGEGDTFYIQYRIRFNCDFIYLDCDPGSPTYKTLHRKYGVLGGKTTATADPTTEILTATNHGGVTGQQITFTNSGGALPGGLSDTTTDPNAVYYMIRLDANTLQVASTHANSFAGTAVDITSAGTGTTTMWRDWTAAKISLASSGDKVGEQSAGACTALEIVLNHYPDHMMRGYHACGWYTAFDKFTGESFFGSQQIDYQPNGTILGAGDDASPTCWDMPDTSVNQRRAWGYTGPDCFKWDSDEWMTVQFKVQIGTWQPDRTGPMTSHVTVWAAHEGDPQVVVIDRDLYLRGPGPSTPWELFGKIWLSVYATFKDDTEVHPVGHIWYDELIVSTQFIADP